MKKIPLIACCALAIVSAALSTWSLIRSYMPAQGEKEYTLYIGTNDKETYQLEMPLEEAKSKVFNICMDHFPDGFTMYDARGVWRDEKKNLTYEYTFVCLFERADAKEVYKVADEAMVALNQSTILVVTNNIVTADFYHGAK